MSVCVLSPGLYCVRELYENTLLLKPRSRRRDSLSRVVHAEIRLQIHLDFLLLSQKLHVNLQYQVCSISEAPRPASSCWPVLTGGHFVSLGVCQLLLFFHTSRRLCVCAVTRRSLHVRRSVKFCRYRQQDSGTVPGAWQPLTPSPHLMTVLSCQPLVSAISPRIQIVTVFLAAELAPPFPSPPRKTVKCGVFVRWDLQTPTTVRIVCMLALYMFGGGGFLCVRSLLTHRDFCCLNVGAAPPRAHTAVPVTSRKRPCSWVSGSGGDSLSSLSCHSSQLVVFHPPGLPLAKLCFTSAIPWNISQLHRTCQLLGAHFALPCFCLLPRILPSSYTACVSSLRSNERQGSARQTPGVWQSYLLCLHISSSPARCF